MPSPLIKTFILFLTILGVIATTFAFAVFHFDDAGNRISFSLIDHDGLRVSNTGLQGRHLLVFFGFTSCAEICPTQLNKLSQVMVALEKTGHSKRIRPLLISVDPERDTPQRMKAYLSNFHPDITGLTGSHEALKNVTSSFKTLLDNKPPSVQGNYQLTHSSIVYVVDEFSRVVAYIPFEEDVSSVSDRVRVLL